MKDAAREGTIGLWDAYQRMANPLVILKDDEWVELTLEDLVAEVTAVQVKAREARA